MAGLRAALDVPGAQVKIVRGESIDWAAAARAYQHHAFASLLESLIRQKRLAGVECAEQGHDLADRAQASAWEVGERLVISLGAVCRACEKPVTVNENLPLLADPVLDERAQREALKDLKKKLRRMDRNRKDRP